MDRLPSASPDPFRLAPRVAGLEPFWVMECAKAADTIDAAIDRLAAARRALV